MECWSSTSSLSLCTNSLVLEILNCIGIGRLWLELRHHCCGHAEPALLRVNDISMVPGSREVMASGVSAILCCCAMSACAAHPACSLCAYGACLLSVGVFFSVFKLNLISRYFFPSLLSVTVASLDLLLVCVFPLPWRFCLLCICYHHHL